MILKFALFFLLNFGALALGGLFTGKGVSSDWYTNLNQAPWTPQGWVFGAAWTSIMIFFTFFMTYALKETKNKRFLISLFAVQWILNVAWNPTFFYFHNVLLGLAVIVGLTFIVVYIFVRFWNELRLKSLLILPYILWLFIATSLNAYIFLNNNVF